MRNPALHARLQAIFGKVIIHNEDEQISLNVSLAQSPLMRGSVVTVAANQVSGGERYAVCCPYCGDRRFRLWLSYAYGTMYRIEQTDVTFSTGLAYCYNENCIGKSYETKMDLFSRIMIGMQPVALEESQHSRLEASKKDIELPPSISLLDPRVPTGALEYLRGRGCDIQELSSRWKMSVGIAIDPATVRDKRPFYSKPALIIPVINHGRVRFWQARWLGKTPEKFADGKDKPKYYIPSNAPKAQCLYNLDAALKSPNVVVVEGAFDVVSVGDPGVGLFQTTPSPNQLSMLVACWGDGKLIWVPDTNDKKSKDPALTKALALTAEWNQRKLFKEGAYVVRLPDNTDPGSFQRKALWELIQQQTGWSYS